MTADRATLLASIDADPWLTYLALADLADEAGEPHLANAWRWLRREMRHPEYLPSRDRWEWGFHQQDECRSWSGLPARARDIIVGFPGVVGCGWNERRTCSEALALAAEALAVLSQRGELESLA